MRLDTEDCDVAFPTAQEVLGEGLEALPAEAQAYLPAGVVDMPKVWINLLELSLCLEHILRSYYRPRSIAPSLSQLQYDETKILSARDRLQRCQTQPSSCVDLHMLHMKAYYRQETPVLSYQISH